MTRCDCSWTIHSPVHEPACALVRSGLSPVSTQKRKPSDDDTLGITGAQELGIVRRWSCGCAEVNDAGVVREQPDMFCDGFPEHGHKARVVQGRVMGEQGSLFPKEDDDEKC